MNYYLLAAHFTASFFVLALIFYGLVRMLQRHKDNPLAGVLFFLGIWALFSGWTMFTIGMFLGSG